METLTFYSYKGDTGRSLLLANTAQYLASLGKGVVALDLDFEAPGLHYKLGCATSRDGEPEKRGGAVSYLVATAQEATSPPSLEEHMIEVPVPSGSGGWLRLMPAGPAPDRAYWTALKNLGDRIRFDDPSGQGLMSLLDLHARIREELKPDYLLIDARAGVTELGGLATTVLADTVVCLFAETPESLDGTLTVAEAVKTAPRLKKQRPIRLVPVLTRALDRPHDEGPFRAGVERLLALSEEHGPGEENRGSRLITIPYKDLHEPAGQIFDGEGTVNARSLVDRPYLELFQHLFPSSSHGA